MQKLISIVVCVLLSTAALAEAPADFSGTWELNTKLGENLGMMAAVKETMVVEQSADRMVADYTDVFAGKTTTRQVTYDLTGGPVENFAAMGDRSTTESAWDGEQLVTAWTAEGAIAGSQVVRTERRWLSDDGRLQSVSMSRGDNPPMVFVFEKVE